MAKLIKRLGCLLVACLSLSATAQPLPKNAELYLPVLKEEAQKTWSDMKKPHYFAGQIEQETCPSLTHSKCWNPKTELKTSREYGFGLGQLTITYNADGSKRYDNFTYMTQKYSALSSWKWDDRYNPHYQMKAIILLDRENYNGVSKLTADEETRYAFMFSAYNGGLGGVLQDRKLCMATQGCDPSQWFGHVEKTSYKAKTKVAGYGKSFFEVNREYVTNVMKVRSPKYEKYFVDPIPVKPVALVQEVVQFQYSIEPYHFLP